MLKEIWIASTELVKFGQLLKLHQIKPLYKDYHYNNNNSFCIPCLILIYRLFKETEWYLIKISPPPLERTKNENKKYNIYMHVLGLNWRKFLEKLNKWAKYNLHA